MRKDQAIYRCLVCLATACLLANTSLALQQQNQPLDTEIFDEIDDVPLLVSGWRGAPPTARLDGMEVVRTGRRYTFPLHARRAFRRMDGKRFDLIVEDVNKSPLFTPRWSDTPVAVLVPHLFGTTVFREAWPPVASAVWLAERRMLPAYEHVPRQASARSTKASGAPASDEAPSCAACFLSQRSRSLA